MGLCSEGMLQTPANHVNDINDGVLLGLTVFSTHSHRLLIPLRGGETLDKKVTEIVFGDDSSPQHVLCDGVLFSQGMIICTGDVD